MFELAFFFQIPVTYPVTAPELALPELDGKTAKMYRGGKICLTDHFKPLWARNVPKFGISHAMALGVCITFFFFFRSTFFDVIDLLSNFLNRSHTFTCFSLVHGWPWRSPTSSNAVLYNTRKRTRNRGHN